MKQPVKHNAHVAHHVKGRMRVRVPSAKGNPEALNAISASLAKVTGVEEVTINETTGSITVNYDPARHIDFSKHLAGEGEHKQVVSLATPPMLTEVDEVAESLEKEAEYIAAHSHTAKAVFDFVRQCDRGLKRATGNQLDFKVVVPLGLAVYAFVEMGIEAYTPVWLTLGIFSFNHFIDLHSHPVPPQETQAQVTAPKSRPVRSI